MTYTVRTDVTLKPFTRQTGGTRPAWVTDDAQAVFELDTGDLVAVNYTSKRIVEMNTLSCRVVAWLVDAEGDPQGVDFDGMGGDPQQAIAVEFKHNASPSEIEALTPSGLAAALRDLVLGVPAGETPVIQWSDEIRQQANVRAAIITARASGEVFDLTVL